MTQQNIPTHIASLHLVGVGGIGLSRLAKYFLLQGRKVSGSDLKSNETVEELKKIGLVFNTGHNAQNLPSDADLLIYSEAIPEQNAERQAAKIKNLPEMSHAQVLAKISEGYKTIAVSGTNGKSTVTAMIGLILEEAGLDPTVFIGSKVKSWQGNLRLGKGKFLVLEADEYKRQFLNYSPFAVVVTNIELDHLDYFKNLHDLWSAFREFVEKVPHTGFIAYNKDDEGTKEIMQSIKHPRVISFGKSSSSVRLKSVVAQPGKQIVEISLRGKNHNFTLSIPSLYNVYNALAAIAAAADLEIPFDKVKTALEKFQGIWRRFEYLGQIGSTVVISDFAHHPTAVLETLVGAKKFYPHKKILLVFQPHQIQRTQLFFKEFINALIDGAPDGLVLCEIFDVPGREKPIEKHSLTSRDMAVELSRHLNNVSYAASPAEAEKQIRSHIQEYDVVIVMGAGDIYLTAENLINTP